MFYCTKLTPSMGCFLLHSLSAHAAISDRKTRKSKYTVSLNLYFVFIFVRAENVLKT